MKPPQDRRLRRGDGWTEQRTDAKGTVYYLARWRTHDDFGRTTKHAKRCTSLNEAEAHLRTVADEISAGRYVPPSQITVTELIAQWIERGAYSWKPATVAVHRQKSRSQIEPYLGQLRAVEVTTPRVQHWIDALSRKGFAPNTIDKAVQTLNGAFNEALRLGIVTTNPVKGTKRPSIKRVPLITWSEADVAKVIHALQDEPLWDAAFRLALVTGMRPGELRTVKWGDIDLDKRVLVVRRTMTKDSDGRQIVGTSTKTGDQRAVALTPRVVASLRVWRQCQRTMRLASNRWQDADFVFTTRYGKILAQNDWQRRLERVIVDAGVPRITLHQIRHSSASLELAAGTHVKIIADRLGHKDIRTTMNTYSHVSAELQRSAAEALEERLFGDKESTSS